MLLEQIRCKKAWGMIEEEMRNHILDQAEANRSQGMGEKEALEEAVRDMGDPVEAGVALDRIHRPQMAWGMLALIGAISFLSIFAQWMVGKADASLGQGYGIKHAAGVIAGYLVMLGVYRIDYSYIGKYAKRIGAVFCALLFLVVFGGLGMEINGVRAWISLGGWNVSAVFLMYLFIPIYGALVYQYRGTGWKGLGKCFAWMLPPAFIAWRMSKSQVLALVLLMSIMLSVAVSKGWFIACWKKFVAAYWMIAAVLPVCFFLFSLNTGYFASYQQERIK